MDVERLISVSETVRTSTAERDELIRLASKSGLSLRKIGALVGMSGPGIKRVLDREKSTQ